MPQRKIEEETQLAKQTSQEHAKAKQEPEEEAKLAERKAEEHAKVQRKTDDELSWRCQHCWTRLPHAAASCRYCKDKTVPIMSRSTCEG